MASVPSLPRRDRIALLGALTATTLLAWAYLLHMASGMDAMSGGGASGMDAMSSGGASGMGIGALQIAPWTAADFAAMFVMWAIMMIGMMLPSATPMTLVYASVARKAARQGTPVAPTAAFVGGYVSVWTLFSAAATLAQWGLDQAALLLPTLVASSPWLGAALLMAAGVYQLTPAKDACLEHCRAPAHFFAEHWQPGTWGAFRLGAHHGAWCLGCCWALMGLLFFGGVMNLLWIAAIALFVLAEKVLPAGRRTARASGVAMIVAGGALAARWLLGGS